MYEFIIIGGGPAGLTAAVYAARKRIKTLLLSKDIGGQLLLTRGVENYMGYQYIEGPELMEKFETQVRQFPIDMKIGSSVTRLTPVEDGFEVVTDKGVNFRSKVVIVATGKRSRPLNVPGEKEFIGRGVTYCAICDGPVFAGQKVAIIGGGNSALEAVDDMIKTAEYIYMVSITPLTGDQILIDKVKEAANLSVLTEHEVVKIEGTDRVQSITVRSLRAKEEKTLAVGGVFVEIGLIPNSDLVKGIAKLNKYGEIMVNPFCETSVLGLFAAGDVTDVPEKQIVVAAGEGSKAALQAHKYLQRLAS